MLENLNVTISVCSRARPIKILVHYACSESGRQALPLRWHGTSEDVLQGSLLRTRLHLLRHDSGIQRLLRQEYDRCWLQVRNIVGKMLEELNLLLSWGLIDVAFSQNVFPIVCNQFRFPKGKVEQLNDRVRPQNGSVGLKNTPVGIKNSRIGSQMLRLGSKLFKLGSLTAMWSYRSPGRKVVKLH